MNWPNKRSVLLILLLGAAAILVTLALWPREPSCHGRTLTSWLQQYCDTPLTETQRRTEAQEAVRAIGAAKALPILLRLVEAEEGPVRSWFVQKQEKWHLRCLKIREAQTTQQLGIAGFEALETDGAPAISELTRLLGDTNHAFPAL